jgi:hypothetical protein
LRRPHPVPLTAGLALIALGSAVAGGAPLAAFVPAVLAVLGAVLLARGLSRR